MSDNRTTELREKLDDLIIELDRLDNTLDSPSSGMTIGEYEQEREKLLGGFTQAIAATLESEPPYDELLRCLENDWHVSASWDGLRKFWCIELTDEGVRLRDAAHGTLTAEQVRELMKDNSHDYPSPTDPYVYITEYDWQAIADELNARAERTCECVSEYAESPFDGKTIVLHRCSECHELMRPHMLYCPNCGARVVA